MRRNSARPRRYRKWCRRHPRLTTGGAVAVVATLLLVAVGAALIGSHQSLATMQSQLSTTREHLDRAETQERLAHLSGRDDSGLMPGEHHLGLARPTPVGPPACESHPGTLPGSGRATIGSNSLPGRIWPRPIGNSSPKILVNCCCCWRGPRSPPPRRMPPPEALTLLDRAGRRGRSGPAAGAVGRPRAVPRAPGRSCPGQGRQAESRGNHPGVRRDHYLLAISFDARPLCPGDCGTQPGAPT